MAASFPPSMEAGTRTPGQRESKITSSRRPRAGTFDLHYRDYEEPPGNGGFLLNGGRLYLDMGHLEYSSPECRTLSDVVAYDLAGDRLIQSALAQMNAERSVSFVKNNIDHHTGATFGCHENYLMRRDVQFNPRILGTLLSFLATRQIFTGAGRVGQASPLAFEFDGGISERARRFPNQPARRSYRQRHLPVGPIQPRDHQCTR
jgi:hypothetical protein